jgi:cysteine desulfurase
MQSIYLDNSATTRLAPEAAEAMRPFLDELYGNPSSLHAHGQKVRQAVETARRHAAALIGARPDTVVFTSGGTESDNLAILGVALAQRQRGRHVVTSGMEHPAVRNPMAFLEAEGWDVTRLPVDGAGRVRPDDLAAALRDDTALVSIVHASSETGTLQDIAGLAALARTRRVPFHTDAVQSVGKLPIDVAALGADLLSYSGHKIHGPKGVGVLYIRPGTPLRPLMHGGPQEKGRRPGTENVPGIVGLGAACRLAQAGLPIDADRIRAARDRFEAAVLRQVAGAHIHAAGAPRAPGISCISFPGADREAVVIALDLAGVAASAGPACSTGTLEPSAALRAMGCGAELLHTAVRFSFSRGNTLDEADAAAVRVAEAVARVREVRGRTSRNQFQSS